MGSSRSQIILDTFHQLVCQIFQELHVKVASVLLAMNL